METFQPPVNPTPDIGHDVEPRVLEAKFGEGYTGRSGDGINHMSKVYTDLLWENVTREEADAITGFFEARAGIEAFRWTPPDTGVEGCYRCTRWHRARRTTNAYVITAHFKEEFDLG